MIKNVKEGLLKVIEGKSIIFIEGDLGLYHTVGTLEKFLIKNKIKYHTILNAGKMSIEGIVDLVNFHDIIVWESQYCTKASDDIMKVLFDDSITNITACGFDQRKILLECYVYEPNWWYKPDGTKKRLLGLRTGGKREKWELYEFGDDHKPIWDKADDEL